MIKRTLLVFLAAAALGARADVSVAVVDMDLVVLAHPQTAVNRTELLDLQTRYKKQRDERLEALAQLRTERDEAAKDAQDPVQPEAKRRQAAARASELHGRFVKTSEEIEAFVGGLQRRLQRREMELFADVMIDIRSKIEALAKEKGYDVVLDKTASRASAPIPIVLFSAPEIEITDAVIAAVGGDREAAEKDAATLLERAGSILYGGVAPDGSAASERPAAPAAAPAKEGE